MCFVDEVEGVAGYVTCGTGAGLSWLLSVCFISREGGGGFERTYMKMLVLLMVIRCESSGYRKDRLWRLKCRNGYGDVCTVDVFLEDVRHLFHEMTA